MKKPVPIWIMAIAALFTASLACQAIRPSEATPTNPPPPTPTKPDFTPMPIPPEPVPSPTPEPTLEPKPEATQPKDYDSPFPLPEDVQDFMRLNENQINFKTNMSLQEVIDFYRDAFAQQGLEEWPATTVIRDDVFSMVFRGAPNGLEVVIQGVNLGNNLTNVNIRYEDVG